MGGSREELEGRRSSENNVNRMNSQIQDQAYWAHDNEFDDLDERGDEYHYDMLMNEVFNRMKQDTQDILDNKVSGIAVNQYKSLDVTDKKMKVLENWANRQDNVNVKDIRDWENGNKRFTFEDKRSYDSFKERAEKSKVPYISELRESYRGPSTGWVSTKGSYELTVYRTLEDRNMDVAELAHDREK